MVGRVLGVRYRLSPAGRLAVSRPPLGHNRGVKVVVGVELAGRSDSALDLLSRLQFPLDQTILVHTIEPVAVTMAANPYGMLVEGDDIFETLHKAGEAVLVAAKAKAEVLGLKPATQLCEGPPAITLIDAAEADKASLIAVSSTVRSSAGAIFGGSVARGLAIHAKQSVLIAREASSENGLLTAVFANDQSPFCAACLRLLVKCAPKGIAHITLLTVHDRSRHEQVMAHLHPDKASAALEAIDKELTEKGDAAAKWLTENGIPTSSKLVSGCVEESIHAEMNESNAGLLIVGSQGHGMVERMLVGSTALHQLVSERYPLLLLRPSDLDCAPV